MRWQHDHYSLLAMGGSVGRWLWLQRHRPWGAGDVRRARVVPVLIKSRTDPRSMYSGCFWSENRITHFRKHPSEVCETSDETMNDAGTEPLDALERECHRLEQLLMLDANWRALRQLDEREAAGVPLEAVDGHSLRAKLQEALGSNRLYNAWLRTAQAAQRPIGDDRYPGRCSADCRYRTTASAFAVQPDRPAVVGGCSPVPRAREVEIECAGVGQNRHRRGDDRRRACSATAFGRGRASGDGSAGPDRRHRYSTCRRARSGWGDRLRGDRIVVTCGCRRVATAARSWQFDLAQGMDRAGCDSRCRQAHCPCRARGRR